VTARVMYMSMAMRKACYAGDIVAPFEGVGFCRVRLLKHGRYPIDSRHQVWGWV